MPRRVQTAAPAARVHAALKRQNVVLYKQVTASIQRTRALSAHNAALEHSIRRLTQELDGCRLMQDDTKHVLSEELETLREKCAMLERVNRELWSATSVVPEKIVVE